MEKLTAPKLPKGYRFKVESATTPNFVKVHLQKKWLFFWHPVDLEFSYVNSVYIHKQMTKLARSIGIKDTRFNGLYPPREEL